MVKSRLRSLQQQPCSAWWRDPTRILAVTGTLFLSYKGLLDQAWATAILVTALGGEISEGVIRAIAAVKGGGKRR